MAEATAQGAAATTPQEQAGSSNPAPGGDPKPATAQQAPMTPVRDPEDALWDRAMGKGAALRERDLLRELGVSSLEEAKVRLLKPTETAPSQPAQAGKDYQALSRELQAELARSGEAAEKLRAENSKLAVWASRALKVELVRELVEAGAHKDGVDILAEHLLPSLAWSDDGHAIEVIERDGDKVKPSRHSLKDLIGKSKKEKSFFFGSPAATGAGSSVGEGSRPQQSAAPQQFDSRRAAAEYRKNRR